MGNLIMFRLEKTRAWLEKTFKLEKPYALSSKGWKEWHMNAKKNHPTAYFWSETVPDFIEDIVWPIERKYDKFVNFFRYRLTHKYHMVDTGLKPDYYDLDTRMLHANMNLLKDYVEKRLAWKIAIFDPEKEKKYKIPRFRRNKWRCPEAGLEYLEWEKDLVWDADAGFKPTDKLYGQLTDQALRAREVIEIYDWWVNIYPNRPEPMDASGWSEFCQKRRDKNGGDMLFDTENETAAEKKESASILKKLRKIEASYEKEEQDMLIRLIKIRKGLWS